MIAVALGVVTLVAGVIFAALVLAILGAYAACGGALIVQAFVDLMPSRHTREPSA